MAVVVGGHDADSKSALKGNDLSQNMVTANVPSIFLDNGNK